MGMYTELQINCELKDRNLGIEFALGTSETPVGFSKVWCGMLQGYSSYFPYEAHSSCHTDKWGDTFLNVRCNIKNYKNQLEEFIGYLHQLIKAIDGDFLGHIRYEEDDLPTLLIYRDDKIEMMELK